MEMRMNSSRKPPNHGRNENIFTDKEEMLQSLKKRLEQYEETHKKLKEWITQLEGSELGPGQFAVHKEYGNCIITKMWPSLKNGTIGCAIMGPKVPRGPQGEPIKFEDLMPIDSLARTLYGE